MAFWGLFDKKKKETKEVTGSSVERIKSTTSLVEKLKRYSDEELEGNMSKGFGYDVPKRVDTKSKNLIKLSKSTESFNKICLTKKVDETITARVALVLDYSGSMSELYLSGAIQELVQRLLPVGIRFDDNSAIDIFLFHSGCYGHKFIGEVTPDEFEGYVDREIYSQYSMGGTSYAPVMRNIINKYTSEEGEPAYVMFVTDGECMDRNETLELIKDASAYGIFWQFIGISDSGYNDMATLKKLDTMTDRVVDNANFYNVGEIQKMSDESLFDILMTEFPQWYAEALEKGIIEVPVQ